LGAIRLHFDTAARVAIVRRQPPAGSRFVASIHPEAFFFESFLRSPHVGRKRCQLRFKSFGPVVFVCCLDASEIFVRSSVESANRRASKNGDQGCDGHQPWSSVTTTKIHTARPPREGCHLRVSEDHISKVQPSATRSAALIVWEDSFLAARRLRPTTNPT
jgi:hypothetical protein